MCACAWDFVLGDRLGYRALLRMWGNPSSACRILMREPRVVYESSRHVVMAAAAVMAARGAMHTTRRMHLHLNGATEPGAGAGAFTAAQQHANARCQVL